MHMQESGGEEIGGGGEESGGGEENADHVRARGATAEVRT